MPATQTAPTAARKLWAPNFPFRPERWPFFYGWVIVLFSTLGLCASMPGQTVGVSVFTTRLSAALNLSTMELSTTYMLGTLLSALWINAGGRLFDRFGARQALVSAITLLGLVLIALSFVEQLSAAVATLPLLNRLPWLPPFLVLTLGFACLRFTGQGMLTLGSRAMLGKWFDKRRGTVTAVSGAMISFAFSGAPLAFEYLIRNYSWQGTWRLLGAGLIILLLPLFWIFARDNPEECGLEMDGGVSGKARRANPDSTIYRDYSLSEARRTFSFWAFTLMFALNGLVITGYAFHIIAIGEELQVGTDYILSLFVPCAAGAVLAGLAIGWLTDQSFVRIKYLLCVMAVSSMLGFSALALGNYPAISWLHIVGFGISGGCFGSLSSIVYPRFFGRQHLGAISGQFMTTIVIASAGGPLLLSLSEAYLGSYRAAFWIASIIAAALGIGALRAENPQLRAE